MCEACVVLLLAGSRCCGAVALSRLEHALTTGGLDCGFYAQCRFYYPLIHIVPRCLMFLRLRCFVLVLSLVCAVVTADVVGGA